MNLGTFGLGAQGSLVRAEARARGGARGELLADGEHKAAFVHAAFAPVVRVGVLVNGVQGEGDIARRPFVDLIEAVLYAPGLLGLATLGAEVGSGSAHRCLVGA